MYKYIIITLPATTTQPEQLISEWASNNPIIIINVRHHRRHNNDNQKNIKFRQRIHTNIAIAHIPLRKFAVLPITWNFCRPSLNMRCWASFAKQGWMDQAFIVNILLRQMMQQPNKLTEEADIFSKRQQRQQTFIWSGMIANARCICFGAQLKRQCAMRWTVFGDELQK